MLNVIELTTVCGNSPGGQRYDADQLVRLLKGRPGWTPWEMATERRITAEYRVWVLTRPGILPLGLLASWTGHIADRVVRRYALRCGIDVVQAWARSWLSGDDRSADIADVLAATEATIAASIADWDDRWGAEHEVPEGDVWPQTWASWASRSVFWAVRAASWAALVPTGDAVGAWRTTEAAASAVGWAARISISPWSAADVATRAAEATERRRQIALLRKMMLTPAPERGE